MHRTAASVPLDAALSHNSGMGFSPKFWNSFPFRYDLRVINFLCKFKEFLKVTITFNWQIGNFGNLF